MSAGRQRCTEHERAEALYRCDGCERPLCEDCVDVGKHLLICRLCGERALPADAEPIPVLPLEEPEPPDELLPALPEPRDRASTVYEPSPEPEPESPAAVAAQALMQHVVVPAATIAMVAALLFFLLEVRSVFLAGSAVLKWIGFWFVTATVLVARYGRSAAGGAVEERQGCYTWALAGATLLVLVASPWAPQETDLVGSVLTGLIILLVWRFATRLTDALALDERPSGRRARTPRLYGAARLRHEAWQRARGETPRPPEDARLQHSRASRSVARLAALGLLLFALGEPFLLAGPPEAGLRALAAMVVFLLAAGMVLASGSATGTYQLVRAREGRASIGVVPARVIAAAAVMVALIALAAAFPGVHYRGTGLLQPETPASGVEREDGAETSEPDPADAPETETERSSQASGGGMGQAASGLLSFFIALGKWLWIPFAILIAILGAIQLGRVLQRGGWKPLGRRLSRFLARLGSILPRRKPAAEQRPVEDPLAGCEALEYLEPDVAIVEAYRRLQVFFSQLGYPRPPRQTPHEYQAGLPARWRQLEPPFRTLTDLYVQATYSPAGVDAEDRRRAVEALGALRAQEP